MSFIFDPKASKGSRIIRVMVNNKHIDREKFYKVATIDYLINGGDGFSFQKAKNIKPINSRIIPTVIKYIRKKDKVIVPRSRIIKKTAR